MFTHFQTWTALSWWSVCLCASRNNCINIILLYFRMFRMPDNQSSSWSAFMWSRGQVVLQNFTQSRLLSYYLNNYNHSIKPIFSNPPALLFWMDKRQGAVSQLRVGQLVGWQYVGGIITFRITRVGREWWWWEGLIQHSAHHLHVHVHQSVYPCIHHHTDMFALVTEGVGNGF